MAEEPSGAADAAPADESLYLRVQLPEAVKVSKLKTGEVVDGILTRDVYSSDGKLFPAGSAVHLTVAGVERRRRERNDHWPWIVNVFQSRHQNSPLFKDARVTGSDGAESSIPVSLLSVGRKFEVHAKAKGKSKPQTPSAKTDAVVISGGTPSQVTKRGSVMILEAAARDVAPPSGDSGGSSISPPPTPVPSGTQCRILLLGDLSASKSRAGDRVQARLLEPIVIESRVILPAGSVFEGTVAKRMPPRMLSRAGSILLNFTSITLPGGARIPVSASLMSTELSVGSHTRIDAEGQLRGERPGKAWMLINGGVSAGIAKGVDDGAQLIIQALVSTATSASTAGVARIVSACASGIFLLTRHGRDVVLPRFTEMEIVLNRPLSLSSASASPTP